VWPRRCFIEDRTEVTVITLNLLAEDQLAQQAEARDPFKAALACGIGLVAACVVAGTCLAHFAAKAKAQADTLQTECETASTTQSAGTGGDTKTLKSVADDILAINHARRIYADQLALVKDLVPDSVELDRISFTLSIETSAPVVTDAGEGKAKSSRARGGDIERLALHLDGKAVSNRPEIEVDQFIQTMRSNETFSSRVSDVKLRSIARNAAPTDQRAAALASASFVIDCQYKDRK
jgi:hypothetical protein